MPDANITKSALARSMKRLMKSKPFAKISVVDICEGCGMNRKSFYYHFKDKYDLVNWIFYTDFIEIVSNSSYSDAWELMTSVGELFYRDQDFYRGALRIEGQNSFQEYFRESMVPIVGYFLEGVFADEEDEIPEEDRTIFGTFFCDSFLAALVRWMDTGCRTEPAEFIGRMRRMITKLAEKLT